MLIMLVLLNISVKAQIYFEPGAAILIETYPDTSSILHNQIFMINDRGEIDLPIVGSVAISNMSEVDLKLFLKKAFTAYVKADMYKITLLYRITLAGGFENPGLYFVRPDQNLWEVIRVSGGFLAENGFKKMKIYRGGKLLKKNIANQYSMGLSIKKLGIKSGDIITVPIPNAPVDFLTRLTQMVGIVATAATVYFAYITTVINVRRR